MLTLKGPITTKGNNNFDFSSLFSEENKSDISFDLSAKQTIHMKYQDLFSLKNRGKKNNFIMSSATNFAWRFKC